MRVWDIHPGYLSRQNLLGEHAEIHAVYSVIRGGKEGYAAHPETSRWRDHLDRLVYRHDLTVKEMLLRGMKHASPLTGAISPSKSTFTFVDPPARQFILLGKKYLQRSQSGRIPLPHCGSEFWAHHRYSVMARGGDIFREIDSLANRKEDNFIVEEGELIEKVLETMWQPCQPDALQEMAYTLLKDLKKHALLGEEGCLLSLNACEPANLLQSVFLLAQKHNYSDLLHTTVFADHT